MRIYNEIVKNTDMGITAINNVRSYAEDEELVHAMLLQREMLKKIKSLAEDNMPDVNVRKSKPKTLQEYMLKMGVFFETLFDKSNDNIAKMLIDGTTFGMNSLQKEINKLQKEGESVPKLADELMSVYQHNITELRSFL